MEAASTFECIRHSDRRGARRPERRDPECRTDRPGLAARHGATQRRGLLPGDSRLVQREQSAVSTAAAISPTRFSNDKAYPGGLNAVLALYERRQHAELPADSYLMSVSDSAGCPRLLAGPGYPAYQYRQPDDGSGLAESAHDLHLPHADSGLDRPVRRSDERRGRGAQDRR